MYLPYRQQVINRRHLCILYCGKKTFFNKIAMTARAEITLLSNWEGFLGGQIKRHNSRTKNVINREIGIRPPFMIPNLVHEFQMIC